MAAALIDFLPRFGGERAAPKPAAAEAAEDVRAAAEERGYRRGRAEAEAAAAAARAEEERGFAARLAAERQAWAAGEAETLAKALDSGIGLLGGRLAEAAARVLRPFLSERLRDRALAELAETVETLLGEEAPGAIRVAGPADLIEALRARLGRWGPAVTVQPGEPDIRITVDGTIVESRLAAWSARLRQEETGDG